MRTRWAPLRPIWSPQEERHWRESGQHIPENLTETCPAAKAAKSLMSLNIGTGAADRVVTPDLTRNPHRPSLQLRGFVLGRFSYAWRHPKTFTVSVVWCPDG